MNGIAAPTLRTISSVMITSTPMVSSARLLWSALRALDRHWLDFDVVEADHALIERAAQLTQLASLRGYDAVHCAAAEQVEAVAQVLPAQP